MVKGIRICLLALLLTGSSAQAEWPPSGWAYWLDGPAIAPIVELAPPCVVMDYSATGGEGGEFSASQIQQIQAQGTTVLAYFSIGEAEEYRFYWNSDWQSNPPSWLGPENPDWAGNYKVRFWEPGWHAILYGTPTGPDQAYLDRILEAGFDGIYLDIVDAYYYWSELAPDPEQNPDAADQMVDLLDSLANYARANSVQGQDFRVIPQNGSWLPLDAGGSDYDRYYELVDGLAREQIFQYQEFEMADVMVDSGKVLLSVEYIDQSDEQAIEEYYVAALGRGYRPLATTIDLDQLIYRDPADFQDVPETPAAPLPGEIGLSLHPNPFNGQAKLTVQLAKAGQLRVVLYDLLGRKAKSWPVQRVPAGSHQLALPGDRLASGSYILTASTESARNSLTIQLLK